MPDLRYVPRREIPARPLTEREQAYFDTRNIRICPSCNLPEGSWLHKSNTETQNELSRQWWERDAHAFGAPIPEVVQ